MGFDARVAAQRILIAVEERGQGSQDAIAEALSGPAPVDPRDRALVTELVYGVLRWRRRLDHGLAALATRGLPTDDGLVMAALRLGAYQILFLPRVPDWAAVDGSVRLVKRRRGEGTARFVNGLLRNLARRREDPPPLPTGSSSEAWGLRHSLPDWLVERLSEGRDAESLEARLAAENRPAPLTVRVNGSRLDAPALAERLAEEGAETLPVPDLPGALRVVRPGGIFRGVSLASGLWLPQDSASQRVVALLDPRSGERVLDLCAGAGVKTTQIGERVGPTGAVRALDLSARRIADLTTLCARWGLENVSPAVADATDPDAAGEQAPPGGYDRVLVDAPCTALGLLRRRPEVRWRRREGDIAERVALQARLLDVAAGLVKPGGRLVYAVCTFTEEEGPAQVRRFLAANEGWRLAPAPDSGAAAARVGGDGFLRTAPTEGEEDAFFAAALERADSIA